MKYKSRIVELNYNYQAVGRQLRPGQLAPDRVVSRQLGPLPETTQPVYYKYHSELLSTLWKGF